MRDDHHAPFTLTGVDGRYLYDQMSPVAQLVRPVPTQPARPQRFVRQAASTLNADQQRAYVDGIQRLVASGEYRRLVAIHEDMSHDMHGRSHDGADTGAARFLPWHRQYLVVFEEALGSAVPYWDYEKGFPAFLADVRPLGIPPRAFNPQWRLPTAAEVDHVIQTPLKPVDPPGARHQVFSSLLKTGTLDLPTHNQVHRWVGGVMATMSSPADPVFWLHHAAIDRIWSLFQWRDPDAYPDRLVGRSTLLDPWPAHVVDVLDVTRLGYRYA
ncbi:tyrosinase family protein [Deinococcus sp. 12RED42]|uniref:tyrosinase family protein n=1 Tax=Deinococcus sp. 12RED42 TaxID=2745872 RepID=UPI001E4C8B4B|nr:tyrosinase family protein [Deinococcus sp. 12RED42]MCD0164935.1 tyrosinase family protein [Deinococcus sp. 12RED42]